MDQSARTHREGPPVLHCSHATETGASITKKMRDFLVSLLYNCHSKTFMSTTGLKFVHLVLRFNPSFLTPWQILALRLLQAVLPSWDKTERSQDMTFLVEKLFGFLGSLLSTCSSDLPLLRGTVQLLTLVRKYKC